MGELGLSTIGNLKALVEQETAFGQTRMIKLDEKILDVAGHTDTTPVGCIVPFDVNTCKFVAGHVELDPMGLLDHIAETVEVFYPNILHPKVINYETLDGTPFVAPEAWDGFSLVISFSKKAGLEEIVGKDASLWKAITALVNLQVDPLITVATLKVVLLNEFHQDVNADVFEVWHWSIKIEILEVDGVETCSWAREHAAEKKLDKFE